MGNDCGLLLISAGILACLGLGVIVGVVAGIMIVWPMIGLALVVAVPVAFVGLAFLWLAWTAVRSAFQSDTAAGDAELLVIRNE